MGNEQQLASPYTHSQSGDSSYLVDSHKFGTFHYADPSPFDEDPGE